MNTQKRVFNKLFSSEKVELASEKFEFAKKAPQILADAKKANDILLKSEEKINQAYLSYKKAWGDFQIVLKVVEDASNLAEKDLKDIMDSLQALGMNPNEAQKIEGFKPAADLALKIQQLVPNFKKLYTKLE